MKKLLLKWLDAVPRREFEAERRNNLQVVQVNKDLRKQITLLEVQLQKERPFIDVDARELIPDDTAKRKMYIAQVAGFHKDILSPKLKVLIGNMREAFEKVNRETYGYSQQEYDLYLKGAINFGWLLHDWGESAINEMISYSQGPEDEVIEELKEKLV